MGGGDWVQINKTKEFLEKLGIMIDISTELEPDLAGYDLVCLFNLSTADDTYAQALNAKKQGKPTVLFSIYWNTNEYLLNNPSWKIKTAKNFGGEKLALLFMNNRKYCNLDWHKQRKILELSDLVIASSAREVEMMQRDFKINLKKFEIIPLGIETEIFGNAKPDSFVEKYGVKDFILSVGRFEGLKNQLKLIDIFGGSDYDLVLIGSPNKKFADYYDLCQERAREYDNVHILPVMPHSELASAYAAAKVHIIPSWFETFSLVSLEAGAVGANVVATKNCPLVEYFSELMEYCDPADKQSIKDAVVRAYQKNKTNELKELIVSKFNWPTVAGQILSACNRLVNDKL